MLPALLRIATENEYLLLYRDARLLGTYAQHPNAEELLDPYRIDHEVFARICARRAAAIVTLCFSDYPRLA